MGLNSNFAINLLFLFGFDASRSLLLNIDKTSHLEVISVFKLNSRKETSPLEPLLLKMNNMDGCSAIICAVASIDI